MDSLSSIAICFISQVHKFQLEHYICTLNSLTLLLETLNPILSPLFILYHTELLHTQACCGDALKLNLRSMRVSVCRRSPNRITTNLFTLPLIIPRI